MINHISSSSLFECVSLIKEIHWIIIFQEIWLPIRLCKQFLLIRLDCFCTYNIPDESCFSVFDFLIFFHMFLICLIHCSTLMIGFSFPMIDIFFYLQLCFRTVCLLLHQSNFWPILYFFFIL